MNTVKSTQTAFRFSPELVKRMKNKARSLNKSVNSYVEELILKDLGCKNDKDEAILEKLSGMSLPEDISPGIIALSRCKFDISDEELQENDKLAYLLTK